LIEEVVGYGTIMEEKKKLQIIVEEGSKKNGGARIRRIRIKNDPL
jgi:hypothetical protein